MSQKHRAGKKPASHAAPAVPREIGPTGSAGGAGTITATVAKNHFGKILEVAITKGPVFISKHNTPKAVLVSFDEYQSLKNAPRRKLDTLSGEFDSLLASMQGAPAG